MASNPSNGYNEVMSGTNNYTGSNFYGSSCPKTPVVPVSNDDLCNKLYVDNALSAPLTNVAQPTSNTVSYNTTTNLSNYTAGTSISLFTNSTTRDTALTAPFLGQFCFLTNSSQLQFYNSGWKNYPTGVSINSLTITGFTLSTNYSVSYVDSGNTPVGAPTFTGFTIYQFYPTSTTTGTVSSPKGLSITYLVVAGGGGGGGASDIPGLGGGGGGGGAGGLITGTDTINSITTYSLTVGQGGTGGNQSSTSPTTFATDGGNGANSSLQVVSGTLTAVGGGGGGYAGNLAGFGQSGLSGGSGGGGGYSSVGAFYYGGAPVGGQGQAGGDADFANANFAGGGGGGFVGGGSAGSSGGGGGGGGVSSITGASITYAGGGGTGVAGAAPSPTGGAGGGGNGGSTVSGNPIIGTDGLGGGGGGGGNGNNSGANTAQFGAKGGSGVVIIRIPSYS